MSDEKKFHGVYEDWMSSKGIIHIVQKIFIEDRTRTEEDGSTSVYRTNDFEFEMGSYKEVRDWEEKNPDSELLFTEWEQRRIEQEGQGEENSTEWFDKMIMTRDVVQGYHRGFTLMNPDDFYPRNPVVVKDGITLLFQTDVFGETIYLPRGYFLPLDDKEEGDKWEEDHSHLDEMKRWIDVAPLDTFRGLVHTLRDYYPNYLRQGKGYISLEEFRKIPVSYRQGERDL